MLTAPVTPSLQTTEYTYLALGDSYTIGEGVTEKERFPYLTVDLLQKMGISVQAPQYIAQTGWSTIALQQAINNAQLLNQYDIVTLLIGVNDQYQHLDTAGYRKRFTELLHKAIGLAGGKAEQVFVLSIPDYSATPFVADDYKAVVRREVDEFNKINKEVSLEFKVAYIDITPLTQEAATDATLLANDRLHYSAKEHLKWAEKLSLHVQAVLK